MVCWSTFLSSPPPQTRALGLVLQRGGELDQAALTSECYGRPHLCWWTQ